MCLKILELRNNRKRGEEKEKGSGELRRRVSLVTQSLKRGGSNVLFISLPRPLKDRLLLTGTAPLSICCLEKLPTSQLIFPDSLLSFLLSPFGGRGIVHFGYYLATLVTMLQLLLRQPGGRIMVLRETE
jgi:hypothetical protein